MNNLTIVQQEDHYLVKRDGQPEMKLPRVTTVIGDVLVDYPDNEAAMERGRIVHHACALIDGGGDGSGLNWSSFQPEFHGYVKAWERFKKETGFVADTSRKKIRKSEAVELKVVSERFGYAGTLDRLGKFARQAELILIDIKTSEHKYPAIGIQLAAYAQAWRESAWLMMRKAPEYSGAIQRLSVHITKDGKYKVERWRDPLDFKVFLSALQIYKWRRR